MRRPLDSASSSSPPPPPPRPENCTSWRSFVPACYRASRTGLTGGAPQGGGPVWPRPPTERRDQSDHAPSDPLRDSNHQQQKQSGFCVYIDPLEFRGPFNLLINLHADGSFCCSDAKKPKPLKKKQKSSKRRGRILLFAQFCCDFSFFCFQTLS